jgi:hypothetical protein
MTKKEAISKAQTGWWKNKTADEIVLFQLYEKRLCMDFSSFHKALEESLERSVFTHELADFKSLQDEFEGKRSPKSLNEIINMLSRGKTIIVGVEK